MSVDVFGRILEGRKTSVIKGSPGIGYKLTKDNHYDIDSKRLCNIADPQESGDAVNKRFLLDEKKK